MDISAKTARTIVLTVLVSWCASAVADPPAHAPAHGWRKKHDPTYVGFSGVTWQQDFEISSGHCNREAIATVVGGVVGGTIASRVADENRTVATIIGIAAGALVGNKIGERLDDADRRCIGHALEIGEAGRPVVWTNDSIGVRYELSPGRKRDRGGVSCREYTMVSVGRDGRSAQTGLACQSSGGAWEIVT